MSLFPKITQRLCGLPSPLSIVNASKSLSCGLHTSAWHGAKFSDDQGGRTWFLRNEKVFPPQKPGEEPRPAFVCHMRSNVRGNYKNMWYQACFVRGMTIDEALKQLSFQRKQFCADIKEVLLEAQEKAVKEQGVEFKSNLWIAESFISKGSHIKGMRRHARMRMGEIRYQYNHYYVRLEEGKPPANVYNPKPSGEEMLQEWLERMRNRYVRISF
ncbi:Hypothetical predicted protein [Cloeon dipterum]|uniref:Large ribosomal subunit protein uL22m n=1 Tax=Cloeon dipterum TaxID=197152 RepID=A0A8S1CFW1_9INSE|nr:Hypothetical predicted protein [Cloeon dipterum]